MTVLVDTGVLIAGFNRRDRFHRWARRLLREVLEGRWGPAFTTDYIIDEVLSYAAARLPGDAGLKLGRLFFEEKVLRVIPVTMDIVLRAWRLYERHYPGLSFTDATTLAVADVYEIDYIATVEKEGLLAKLHPSLTPP